MIPKLEQHAARMRARARVQGRVQRVIVARRLEGRLKRGPQRNAWQPRRAEYLREKADANILG